MRVAGGYAQALAAERDFAVALVDVQLPDGEGTALAAELKQRQPDLEVILLTGFATVESAAAAVRSGAWAYLTKPCSPEDLLLTIRQAMRHVLLLEERRSLSQRAAIAEKLAAVGTLAAGLSHEIRNPLNAASLQLTLLERRLRRQPIESQAQYLEPLDLVQHEIRRLSQIVADFLQFARPRDFTPVSVDLGSVVDSVVALLRAQAEAAGLRLEQVIAAPVQIDGDAGLLQQVLINLVLNALQATPRKGWVRISLAQVDSSAVLKVEDSGPGIPHELRSRVFEPFFTTKEMGSGLGLPFVHSIVQQHGGTIAVEDAETGGASLVITLPLSASHAQRPTPSAISDRAPS